MAGRGIAILVIPIIFSFVYGGAVLGSALQGQRGEISTTSQGSIEIINLQGQYASTEKVGAEISITDPAFNCGDLYITVYDISGGQKKAAKQGAFFDQCYGQTGTLPLDEKFSEKFAPGQYVLEAQLFDKDGNKFLSTTQKFNVQ